MSSNLLDNPKLFRHLVEDLPVGIYIVDRDGLIRFWNRGAEHLIGHLSHEVVGHVFEEVVRACNRRGNSLSGEHCPVTMTLSQRQPQRWTAYYLHKNGHRVAVTIRTRPILEYGDTVGGVTVLFEEAFVYREGSSGPPMYGCLDANTGVPSHRLTRALLNECIAGMEESHVGFGLLRIRVLGLEEFRSKHGPQSIVPFLRTAAQTLRHSLDAENFLGRWGENEFLAVLSSASPVMLSTMAETLWNLLGHSEVLWWGDRFPVDTEVSYIMATAGLDLECLLLKMRPSHSSGTARAAGTGFTKDTGRWRG
ncbi:MAG TPA: PAS domain S-box protein [Terriglobales bacterium]|jgi:PAS domain S-box-containing protein|nr:PAS domain S-box protein [Terriglobales bacterium]